MVFEGSPAADGALFFGFACVSGTTIPETRSFNIPYDGAQRHHEGLCRRRQDVIAFHPDAYGY